jgi:branched-chain amino acid transport system substrate-binding protein
MNIPPRLRAAVLVVLVAGAVGCATDELKIGAIVSETGPLAPYGEPVRRGLDLALEQINAAGGFRGRPLQLLYRDDASQPEAGAAAARELIEEQRVRLIIGAVSSPVTLAIAPICEEKEVLLLSPTASAPSITAAGKFIMRNYPSDVLEGTAMADFARERGLHRVAIFAVANEYGRGLEEVFTKAFASGSREIVASFAVPESDAQALAPMVAHVAELKPEGIYVVAYLDEMSALLQQLHEAGVESLVLGSSSVTEKVIERAGAAAERLVFPQPSFDAESSETEVALFVQAYREKHDQDPDVYAAHGYDALKLLYQAIVDTDSAYPEDVQRGLHSLKDFTGAAGRTVFDERGDVVRYPRLHVIHEGRAMPLERFEEQGGQLVVPDES